VVVLEDLQDQVYRKMENQEDLAVVDLMVTLQEEQEIHLL
jgi:hypothetical protein